MENIGKIGQDKLTGFRGVVTAKVEYLIGESQYELTPNFGIGDYQYTTSLVKSGWFITSRIKIIEDLIQKPI